MAEWGHMEMESPCVRCIWDFGSLLEGGYEWNLGDRDSTQRFSYGGAYDIIGFDIADRGQYYIKATHRTEEKWRKKEKWRYIKNDDSY